MAFVPSNAASNSKFIRFVFPNKTYKNGMARFYFTTACLSEAQVTAGNSWDACCFSCVPQNRSLKAIQCNKHFREIKNVFCRFACRASTLFMWLLNLYILLRKSAESLERIIVRTKTDKSVRLLESGLFVLGMSRDVSNHLLQDTWEQLILQGIIE